MTAPAGQVRLAAPGRRWTPWAALRRARAVVRDEGLRTLSFRLLGETVYRRLALVVCPLADPPPAREAAVQASYGFLSEGEADDYVELRPDTSADEVVKRLPSGHRCFVGRNHARLVSARWIAPTEVHVEYLDRRFSLRPGEVFLYETYTAPSLRGLGISGAAGTRLLRVLAAEGLERVVAGVMPDNRPAVRAWEKAGYRRVGTIGFVRLGPWRRDFFRPTLATGA